MNRLFERHHLRHVDSLDGLWRFKTDPDGCGLADNWSQGLPEDAAMALVPSCWNNELGLFDYRGRAWYERDFDTDGGRANLVFHGVTGQADVYVDGKHLAAHFGSFSAFSCLTGSLGPGRHRLTLSVDNRHSLDTIPGVRADWFYYGGITRHVEIMHLRRVWICKHRVDYVIPDDPGSARLDIELRLQSLDGLKTITPVKAYLDGRLIAETRAEVSGERTVRLKDIRIEDIRLWDVGSPNLCLLRLEIEGDDIVERIGFRKISVNDGQLLLNGKPLLLKGVNRHEDHPDWGFALPLKLMKRDMDIIRDMGCNAIRGAHYPNSELFLDLCDQEGMLFWEEIPMWGFDEETLQRPAVRDCGLMMLAEMVERDRHHPSIILWGLHNEIQSSTRAGFDITAAFADLVRSLDDSRLLTFASNRPLEDICFALVDVISINAYPGWYGSELDEWPQLLQRIKDRLEAEGQMQKPLFISEFGAGAIYGQSTFENEKWTENYQQQYLEYTLPLLLNDPDICGSFIWQFCDIRVNREGAMSRPRTFNNKGIVNEYRNPKMAYWSVKKIYRAASPSPSMSKRTE